MSKNVNQQHLRCRNCQNRLQQQENNNESDLNIKNNKNQCFNKIDDLINQSNFESLSIAITQQELNELKLSNQTLKNFASNISDCTTSNEETNVSCNHISPFCEITKDSSWQNKKLCIIDRLTHMYLNEELADVYFIVGRDNEQKERIVAHKFILSISSSVFNAMFYGTGQKMNTSNEIEIPDVDAASFKSFLRYLYTDEITIEHETVMSILYISKKYSVNNLEIACVDYLKKNLKIENAFMLLQQAVIFDENQLADLCFDLIDKFTFETLVTDCFLDIGLPLLKSLLARDTLNIKEFKLYEFAVKWAQAQCLKLNLEVKREHLQSVLDDTIKLIRFPLMTKEEFALVVSLQEYRLLSDQQIIEMFLYLTLNNPKRETEFNTTPRSGKLKQSLYAEQVINRFCQVESRWGYSGISDRVRFSVDKRIYIVGVGLYGSIYGKCEYQVLIQLIHFETCNICAQNSHQFMCDGSNSTFRVMFREPVEIEPNTDYILAATLKGPDSYYGIKGMRTITHENSINGNQVTFQFQYASGNNNGSSVEDGQLPEIIFVYNIS